MKIGSGATGEALPPVPGGWSGGADDFLHLRISPWYWFSIMVEFIKPGGERRCRYRSTASSAGRDRFRPRRAGGDEERAGCGRFRLRGLRDEKVPHREDPRRSLAGNLRGAATAPLVLSLVLREPVIRSIPVCFPAPSHPERALPHYRRPAVRLRRQGPAVPGWPFGIGVPKAPAAPRRGNSSGL